VYPVALDSGGWKKAGVAASSLRAVPNAGSMKSGTVPLLKLGAFELPSVPALSGDDPVKEREQGLGIELDGLVGAGLLANFRVTLADGGRTMWLEDMPREALTPQPLNWVEEPVDDALYEELDKEDAAGKAGTNKATPSVAKPPAGGGKAGAPPKAPSGAKP
jgi:hypothetical protein